MTESERTPETREAARLDFRARCGMAASRVPWSTGPQALKRKQPLKRKRAPSATYKRRKLTNPTYAQIYDVLYDASSRS